LLILLLGSVAGLVRERVHIKQETTGPVHVTLERVGILPSPWIKVFARGRQSFTVHHPSTSSRFSINRQNSFAMLHGAPERQDNGQICDARSKGIGKVNTFGQVVVRFHNNPKKLEHWFQHAQQDLLSPATPLAATRSKLPTPRLCIAIHICGSRGDVQPFIPIAKLLQAAPYRHRVRICTHPAFKNFVVSLHSRNVHGVTTNMSSRRRMELNFSRLEETQKRSWR